MKYSKQREQILNIINNSYDHPTAYMVYEEVRKDIPNISLGTVYRNLNSLCINKQIRRLAIPNDNDRFDKINNQIKYVDKLSKQINILNIIGFEKYKNQTDEEVVRYEDIIGKVIYVMPNLGNMFALLKNKYFFASCMIILILVTLYDLRVKKRKLERKKIREKYEKKSNFYF